MPEELASRRVLVLGAVTATIAGVDLATKQIATATLEEGPMQLAGPLWLRLGHNSGVAFGLGDSAPSWLIATLTLTLTAVLAAATWRSKLVPPVALAIVLGGAIANLIDRVGDASVVDMIDIGPWPTFNLADIAITSGLGMALLEQTRRRPHDPARKAPG